MSQPTPPKKKRFRLFGFSTASLHLMVLGLVVFTIAAFLGRLGWLIELTSHFRVQYFFVALVLMGSALFLRKWIVAAFAGVCLVVNLAVVAPAYFGADSTPSTGPTYKVMLLNVLCNNDSHDQVIELIRANRPDWFTLNELTPKWVEALEALALEYPHKIVSPGGSSNDPSGIGLYSAIPIESSHVEKMEDVGWPSVIARLKLGDGMINVIGTHPLPPGSRELSWSRNRQLQAVARRASVCEGPVILLGDLNVTPWSPVFSDLLKESGLRDSRRGHGLQPSWPSDNVVLRIPIDHCLVSPDVLVHRRWIGPAVGSDHFPVFVEISLAK